MTGVWVVEKEVAPDVWELATYLCYASEREAKTGGVEALNEIYKRSGRRPPRLRVQGLLKYDSPRKGTHDGRRNV